MHVIPFIRSILASINVYYKSRSFVVITLTMDLCSRRDKFRGQFFANHGIGDRYLRQANRIYIIIFADLTFSGNKWHAACGYSYFSHTGCLLIAGTGSRRNNEVFCTVMASSNIRYKFLFFWLSENRYYQKRSK